MSPRRGRSGYIAELVMLRAGGARAERRAGPCAQRLRTRPRRALPSTSLLSHPLLLLLPSPPPYTRPFSILPGMRHMVLRVRPRAGNHVTCPFVCRGALHSGPFVARRKWPICRQLETPWTCFYPQERLTLSGGRMEREPWGWKEGRRDLREGSGKTNIDWV